MTELYNSIIEHATNRPINKESLELAHKVWDPTPWVIDVYIGKSNEVGEGADERAIREWCKERFGKESWPIHDKPADWYRGGATIDGWTWFGFATEQMMNQFQAAWPDNIKSAERTAFNGNKKPPATGKPGEV